jgi:hypothetical protein
MNLLPDTAVSVTVIEVAVFNNVQRNDTFGFNFEKDSVAIYLTTLPKCVLVLVNNLLIISFVSPEKDVI